MRARTDNGAAAVEFALVLIPFIILVLGMIQYGWFFYVSQTSAGAASNVVRRLEVGDCWGTNEALNLARAQSPTVTAVSVAPSSITATTPTGTDITVTVQADGRILGIIPMPGGGRVTKVVHASLEDTAAKPCT